MSKYIVYGIILTVVVSILLHFHNKAAKENLKYSFKDEVENVSYDEKGIPTVKISGRDYYLSGYNFYHSIEAGDSLIKYSGSTTYKLIKKKSGITKKFDN
jgi:hypothetical protein